VGVGVREKIEDAEQAEVQKRSESARKSFFMENSKRALYPIHSKMVASPCPTPTHKVTSPYLTG
jgi:hypothetical protein